MSSKKRELTFLEPVDKLPASKKGRQSMYDEIISEFLNSNLKLAKIKPMQGKKAKSMFQSLYKRIKDNKHPIKVRVRGQDIYLELK